MNVFLYYVMFFFFAKKCHSALPAITAVPMSKKECVGFFISFRYQILSYYLQKFKKTSFLHTRFYVFINNTRL